MHYVQYDDEPDDWPAENWKSAALTTLALAFCLGVTLLIGALCSH